MSDSKQYSAKQIEDHWYQHWMANNYFHSKPDDREPFTIVIPPPNVTGVLHMGHMLNNTIQDILIRKARMDGKNACWVPGTDHASIATEAKVVRKLREQGVKKSDLSRDEFLSYAFEWKEEYGGIILEQLKKLGASCDWERTRFTMEPKMSKAVLKVFVDLYKKGKIYRRKRMTNWDPEALTVLSNEEVIHKEENAQLVYIRYGFADGGGDGLVIATQRPETIMADTAVAVNPKDERFKHLIGKEVLIPLINRAIPVIGDDYVDVEFGTGALKITPAHDPNDYEIGERHELEVIDILNANGTLNELAQILVGQDRFEARKNIKKMLKESGHMVKLEDYQTKIGRSERTDSVVEPRLTLQWFVDMKGFAKTALEAVKKGEVKFYPEYFWNMFYNWLNEDNIRDWCISRQLWWGQQIPAWYYGDEVFVAETPEAALAQAREKTGKADLTLEDLRQDEDVVDTWFSSWLWPISVFDGFETREELAYYYPTNVLVTGWDIMFFWVARMIMAGYEWSENLLGKELVEKKGREPFHDVYFTGMVRDNKKRKMSKSLGNSPDALALLDRYGADGVRFGMLSSAAAGNDIIFDAPFDDETNKVLNQSELCNQGSKFCNKIWNVRNAIFGWPIVDSVEEKQQKVNTLATKWFANRLDQALAETDKNFQEYRLSDVLMSVYKLIWNDFCSSYIEIIKPEYGQPIDRATYDRTIEFFETLMQMLHPFMPFITEETWHQLRKRGAGEDCIVSAYPQAGAFDKQIIQKVETALEVVSRVKMLRSKHGISSKDLLPLFVENRESANQLYAEPGLKEMVIKMANLENLEFADSKVDNSLSFVVATENYALVIQQEIDVEAERMKLEEELEHQRGFLISVEKKLSNERFVNNAPPAVVDKERKKQEDAQKRIQILEEGLARL